MCSSNDSLLYRVSEDHHRAQLLHDIKCSLSGCVFSSTHVLITSIHRPRRSCVPISSVKVRIAKLLRANCPGAIRREEWETFAKSDEGTCQQRSENVLYPPAAKCGQFSRVTFWPGQLFIAYQAWQVWIVQWVTAGLSVQNGWLLNNVHTYRIKSWGHSKMYIRT